MRDTKEFKALTQSSKWHSLHTTCFDTVLPAIPRLYCTCASLKSLAVTHSLYFFFTPKWNLCKNLIIFIFLTKLSLFLCVVVKENIAKRSKVYVPHILPLFIYFSFFMYKHTPGKKLLPTSFYSPKTDCWRRYAKKEWKYFSGNVTIWHKFAFYLKHFIAQTHVFRALITQNKTHILNSIHFVYITNSIILWIIPCFQFIKWSLFLKILYFLYVCVFHASAPVTITFIIHIYEIFAKQCAFHIAN